MKTKVLIIFLFITSLYSAQNLKGVVKNAESNAPIDLVMVSIPDLHLRTTTNSEGVFYFNDLPEVALELVFELYDYENKVVKVNMKEATEINVALVPKHTVFEEVIISASEGKLNNENITSVDYRSKENIFETGATTLGEAIVNIPGVQQSTIGTGVARPVIRGLSGMRVVTFWNGLRVENQQWGGDHGMATSEAGMQGVEVIKGPSSLLYGADAIGGVIYYHDEPFLSEGESEFEVSQRGESNSMGTTTELGYRSNNGKIKINAHGNFMSHTDYMLPDGNFVENSRFWVGNAKLSLGFRQNNYIFKLMHQFSLSQIGVPGHTHDFNPTVDQFIGTRRGLRKPILPAQFINNNMTLLEQRLLFENSDLLIHTGFTRNHLREFDHNRTTPFLNKKLNTIYYNVKYNHDLSRLLNFKTGVQGMVQLNRNGLNTEQFLVPDANSIDAGAYALLNYELEKWRFQLGARYDLRSIRSFETPEEFAVNISSSPIDRLYQTINYSAGLMRKAEHLTTRFNLSSGYRAPHYSELLADGVHHGSLRYEKGDRDLVPEQALQLDLSIELNYNHFEFFVNPYVSMVNNFIFIQAFDSVIASPAGTYSYFEYEQVDRALLYGGEVGFHYHPHQLHRLHLSSDFSLTIGEDQSANPIDLIPQPNLNSRIRFDINNKNDFKFEFFTLEHQYFLAQNRVAVYEKPTSEFHLINFSLQMSYKENIGLQLGARNILNTMYIAHLSPLKNIGTGLAQPGINFFVKLSLAL
jgi:iron complex outermembrane receptor protein